jgi:hypothetical protein
MGKMWIEPFGDIEFHYKEKEWFGIVQNISSNNTIELSIGAENKNIDISDRIEKIKLFAKDYNSVMTTLYELVHQSLSKTEFKKSLDEVKEMYFLTAVSLKDDNKTWWLVLEPDFKVDSIYNHFLRFTMIDRKVTWTNFNL